MSVSDHMKYFNVYAGCATYANVAKLMEINAI